MKRRVISIITALALCLSLCPTWVLAADLETDTGLCPHHWVHTEECGYVPPASGRDCAHIHDESCFIAEVICVHQHTEDCYPEPDPDSGFDSGLDELEPSLCAHECSEGSGCVTLTLECPHAHDESCGYALEDAGAPCTFACRVCPIEDLIDKLPRSVTPDNRNQVEDQLNAILVLYAELTDDEQAQLDLSLCLDLQGQLNAANAPLLIDDGTDEFGVYPFEWTDSTPITDPWNISNSMVLDMCGEYSFTASKSTSIRVQSGGKLCIKGGPVTSQNGVGVEVQSGGLLLVKDPSVVVTGTSYGLDIASGATVKLSGGTYTGKTAAIRTADGNFDALLESGYAYFDASGNSISDVKNAKTVVVKAQLGINWGTNTPVPVSVDYDGGPVAKTELPNVIIKAPEDLSQYLEYSYKKKTDSTYTKGLPTNAGTYDIMVSLPELPPNYCAAYSEPITLTINKIDPVLDAPTATQPTYNRGSQALVTAGSARTGAVIQFAQSADGSGPYSTDIPIGINAGNYSVWYKIVETENYSGASGKIAGVLINPKEITPTIDLFQTSYVFDGSKKEPVITVRDEQTVIEDDQYKITWAAENGSVVDAQLLRAAGKYKATITSQNKNYTFTPATATVEIVEATQGGLSITGKPSVVCYGDKITSLATSGGTGNGDVKWTVSDTAKADIEQATGVLEIKDMGELTVTAERTVENYGAVKDTWTFTVQPKPVTAVVTVAGKTYDTTKDVAPVAIVASVSDDLVKATDSVTISGLTGWYDDANVGTNKTVTLNSSTASVGGADASKYSVSYPATARADINPKKVTNPTITLSGNDLQTDNNATPPYFYNYDGNEKEPTVTLRDDDLTIIPASNYTVRYYNNKNVSKPGDPAKVTVTANAGGNYEFDDAVERFEIKDAKAVLTLTPKAKDLTYNGKSQGLVDVGTATGGHIEYSLDDISYSQEIPMGCDARTYTVYYKVVGDGNHAGTDSSHMYVTIKPKEITPAITLDQDSYEYDGNAKEPGVTVMDGDVTIDKTNGVAEFTVDYSNNTDAGTATVNVRNANGGNYIVNGTKTFQITKVDPTFTPPAGKGPLQYNGTAQELITRGSSPDGKMVYSLDGANYSEAVPTGMARGTYTVYYKVLGDANHNDLTPAPNSVGVKIEINTVNNPTITLSSDRFTYNSSQQIPTIIAVWDDNGLLIPENEYKAEVTGESGTTQAVDVGTYKITVTERTGSNYVIQSNNTREFNIVEAEQETISITGMRDQVYYGDVIQLGTTGGTGNGTVTWSVDNAKAEISSGGLLTVKDVGGPIKVTAERSSSDNYKKISATWEFSASAKPVTAVLTGVDKVYDSDPGATVKARVDPSDLVAGDSISIVDDLTGNFEDDDVGTNKRITITPSTPAVNGTNAGKYAITYPGTATASITPAVAAANAPIPIAPLTYKADEAQALVNAGSVVSGSMVVYSLDGNTYSPAIPTAQNADKYTVYYKALGDKNHTDSPVDSVPAEIQKQRVAAPQVELRPSYAQFDGSVKQPTVIIVRDGTEHTIPDSEYKATCDPATDWKSVGTHTVKIENLSGGNYIVDTTLKDFEITKAEQNPLGIVNKPGLVYYGDAPFRLSAVGGSGNGAITWKSDRPDIADIDASGLVTIKDVGTTVTITAEKAATQNYEKTTADYQFTVNQKPITAAVNAHDKVYDGGPNATIDVTWESGALVGNDSIELTGKFENEKAGTNKEVTISVTRNATSQKYDITIPPVTASISKAKASAPTLTKNNLTYDGSAQELVSGGDANTVYSDTEDDGYTDRVPTGEAAGEYTFWYKDQGDENHTESEVKTISVTIEKATPTFVPDTITASVSSGRPLKESILGSTPSVPGSFSWTDGETIPISGNLYEVTFTPGDTDNYHTVTVQVPVTVTTGISTESSTSSSNTNSIVNSIPTTSEPSAVSSPIQTSVQNGTATTVVNAAASDKLVQDAVANQSKNVVIKPEITSGVTKTQVSLPASTVSRLNSETNAGLTVSTPVADVAIPNAALGTLSSAGGAVDVVTEQVGNAVSLTLTAGGKTVESVPGGLTLTVPVEDAVPGTVAVLVREDGTRETIRKSVAENGELSIPLDGSATVEIVDNSKEFADVAATDWEADAVAFASAHELFNGTSETTFGPDQTMSRAMLATVLYNLEGCPTQNLTGEFSDVSSDAWYAEGVSWATENGITNGLSDGEFGPDDSVTREQFAVMLWRFAGSPASNGQPLDFTDADQASSYAMEALRWAAENGVLNGYGNGQLDPGGVATRAEAAQMLKNFMENT